MLSCPIDDHLVPPYEGVPNDEAPCNHRDDPGKQDTGCGTPADPVGPSVYTPKVGAGAFDFKRLVRGGQRVLASRGSA